MCLINKDAKFDLQAENCLIKTEQSILDKFTSQLNILLNQDPDLTNVKKNDFSLKSTSPCKGQGKVTSVLYDITGTIRNNPPSIGAYE